MTAVGCANRKGISDFIINADGMRILDRTPLGDAGQALNDNFTLLGRRSATHVHHQIVPAATWTIVHGLGRPVTVTIVDSTGEVVYGDLLVIDLDTVRASFSSGFSGKAHVA